jgi:dTDP-4-dehydrorhamnose 3,5-epimerase
MNVFDDVRKTSILGCYLLSAWKRRDIRGVFVKTFHFDEFQRLGLATEFREDYYSVSHQNVLRGMHFQRPPHQHDKLVYCPFGEILDAVVDLRHNSPTFGHHEIFTVSAENAVMVYVPSGVAHGFLARSEQAIAVYKVTTVYAPQSDAGVRWDSCGIPWPETSPIVSERDMAFPTLAELDEVF